jgi:hypothetical protein
MTGDAFQDTRLNREGVGDENSRAAYTPCALSKFTAKQPRWRIASSVGLALLSETSSVGGDNVTLTMDEQVIP